jgi:hypothetical protein
MLGLGHAVVHGVSNDGGLVSQAAATDDTWHSGHGPGSAECRLLDQLLGHADVLATAAAAVPPVPPLGSLLAVAQASEPGSGCASSYQARAPPGA